VCSWQTQTIIIQIITEHLPEWQAYIDDMSANVLTVHEHSNPRALHPHETTYKKSMTSTISTKNVNGSKELA
jgi:hypothetical protein